ncbi:hypothetical protein IFM89_035870 [Coptis chinensis]|uniref:RNase III domain-containing protein n=1 Tax=Coptis chinensis TaxID=261450 RepID=A0A835H2G4_9MAGN|nr:hypothetical protein IFM89_035870 [Coptis chinensis]
MLDLCGYRGCIKSGNITLDASVIRFSDEALDEQKHSIRIADEKVVLAVQAYDLDQYLRKFDEDLRRERDTVFALGVSIMSSMAMQSLGTVVEVVDQDVRSCDMTEDDNFMLSIEAFEQILNYSEKIAHTAVRHGLFHFVRHNVPSLDAKVNEFSLAIKKEEQACEISAYGGKVKAPKVLADIVEPIAVAVYVDAKIDLKFMWENYVIVFS